MGQKHFNLYGNYAYFETLRDNIYKNSTITEHLLHIGFSPKLSLVVINFDCDMDYDMVVQDFRIHIYEKSFASAIPKIIINEKETLFEDKDNSDLFQKMKSGNYIRQDINKVRKLIGLSPISLSQWNILYPERKET